MDPEQAARIFDKNPYEFSKIDNQVDILLGTVKISIVPTSIATVGETRLYQSLFGTGLSSFEFKEAVFSGDQSGEMKVLGISWTPSTDTLRIDLNANVHVKKNGLKTGPAIDFSDVNSSMPQDIMKCITWRLLLQDYDPFGIISIITLKGKLIMRIICLEKLEWDQKVSEEARRRLVDYIDKCRSIVNVPFPRTVVPENITGLPMMLMFSDGSASAYCCLCCLRWPTANSYFVVLVAAKTHVVPLRVESIPLLELLGCLISS